MQLSRQVFFLSSYDGRQYVTCFLRHPLAEAAFFKIMSADLPQPGVSEGGGGVTKHNQVDNWMAITVSTVAS